MSPGKQMLLLPTADDVDIARRLGELPRRRRDLRRNPFTVRIIHINDFHNAVAESTAPGEWFSPLSSIHGLLQSRREQARANKHAAVLFISAGDDMVGTLWDYLIRDSDGSFHGHATYHFWSQLGLDVSVAGNHDFDYGCRALRAAIVQDANFPVISANLTDSLELKDVIAPAAVIEISGVRIGVLGLTTMAQQRSSSFNRYRIASPLDAARWWVPRLKRSCDAVVAISHLGSSVASPLAEVVECGDRELASALENCKPDLIIGGHTHEVFQTTYGGVPVAQVGCNGQWAGEIELTITGDKNGVLFLPLSPLVPDPGRGRFYRKHVAPYLEEHMSTIRPLQAVVGYGPCPSGLARADCRWHADCSIALVLADVLLARLRTLDVPIDFVLLDGSAVNATLPTGSEVRIVDLFRVMPYADSVVAVDLRAEALGDIRRSGPLYFSSNVRWEANPVDSVIALDAGGRTLESTGTVSVGTTDFTLRALVRSESGPTDTTRLLTAESVRETGLFLRDEMVRFLLQNQPDFAPCHATASARSESKNGRDGAGAHP